MKLLLKYLKNYKKLIVFNVLGIFSFALVELGIPTIVADMIDNGIAVGDKAHIAKMGFVILAVAVAGGLGSVLLAYSASKISTGVTRDMRNDIFAKSQEYSHAEYNKFGVSSMITRTTNDAFQLMQFTNILLRTALLTPVMFLVSLVMILRTSVQLSLVLAVTVPVICAGVVIVSKLSHPISVRQQKGLDLLNRISRENLTGIRVIRAFGNDGYEQKRFSEANDDYAAASKKLFKLMSTTQPAFFLLLNLAILVIFWISSQKIDAGTLQIGQLVAFLEYMFHAMFSIMLFSMVFILYPRAEVSANRIRELLEEQPQIISPAGGVKRGTGSGEVVFDRVTFTYPDSEEPVLQDVSFTARRGETVAFIGSTGSGKSTLLGLIPRFYDVTEGRVLVDGEDVRSYDLEALRRKIGLIPQKALLFTGTVADNIRFGAPDADEADVRHAAEVAQAADFIEAKPLGYDEPVSEGGSNLSGGQKQRLSIARAVARRPEIYIFDDSFSALDLRTDAALRARLKRETGDAVVLIVAQRVSSILDATRIIVLDEGRVVGAGTHRQLLRNCAVYYEIAASQLTKEELEHA